MTLRRAIAPPEGLERITGGQEFNVILCDLMMPVMTGADFHRELSVRAPEQACRIVFLTGGAFTVNAREFLDGYRISAWRNRSRFTP